VYWQTHTDSLVEDDELDFARKMNYGSSIGVDFVSATQNFSTADAMGRLEKYFNEAVRQVKQVDKQHRPKPVRAPSFRK